MFVYDPNHSWSHLLAIFIAFSSSVCPLNGGRTGQLEGLAIIAKYLKCKVSIYRLYSETEEPQSRLVESDKKEFQEIYQSLNGF